MAMPSFAELGVEDKLVVLFVIKIVMFEIYEETFGGSMCSFSLLSQKVNITIAGVAGTCGGGFRPREFGPTATCMNPVTL